MTSFFYETERKQLSAFLMITREMQT